MLNPSTNGRAIIEDITYYVDGSTGNNANDGLSWGSAFQNLDFLRSDSEYAIYRNLQADITVYVRNDIYSTGSDAHTIIDKFYGPGEISIYGTNTDIVTGLTATAQDNTSTSTTYGSYIEASGATLTVNAHRGDFIEITAGTGSGSTLYPILSNTATRLETYAVANTDASSVFKIVRGTEFQNATIATPGTPISYSEEYAINVRDNKNKKIYMDNFNFMAATAYNEIGMLIYSVDNMRMENTSHAAPCDTRYSNEIYKTRSIYFCENYLWIGDLTVTESSYYKCIFGSIDGTSYGLYGEYTRIEAGFCRYDNLLWGISLAGTGLLRVGGINLFNGVTDAIFPVGGYILINTFLASQYINFINCSNAINCAGGEFLIGKTCTFQGSGNTTEVKLGDTMTATFAEINANSKIANGSTGTVFNYYDESSYVPVHIDEYDNSVTGLVATSYQGAIDEVLAAGGGASKYDATVGAGGDYADIQAAITGVGSTDIKLLLITNVAEDSDIAVPIGANLYIDLSSYNLSMGSYQFTYTGISNVYIRGNGIESGAGISWKHLSYPEILFSSTPYTSSILELKDLYLNNTTGINGAYISGSSEHFSNIKYKVGTGTSGISPLGDENSYTNIWFVGGSSGSSTLVANTTQPAMFNNIYVSGQVKTTTCFYFGYNTVVNNITLNLSNTDAEVRIQGSVSNLKSVSATDVKIVMAYDGATLDNANLNGGDVQPSLSGECKISNIMTTGDLTGMSTSVKLTVSTSTFGAGVMNNDLAFLSSVKFLGGVTFSSPCDDIGFLNCQFGADAGGGALTLTILASSNRTRVVGCMSDVAIVDNGTDSELGFNTIY